MPDTRRTWADLDTIFPDNTAGAISPQDLRDFVLTVQAHQAAVDPTVTDDGTAGFDVKSWWVNTATPSLWVCFSNATGAAVWKQVYPAIVAVGPATVNAYTGTAQTLALVDAEAICTFDNASPITVTVPPNSSVAFPVGTTIGLIQLGAGQVTVAAGAGVTINSYSSLVSIAAQGLPASLVKLATDTWELTGGLA